MSETYKQHYLDELTAFADRTGEVPPGLDDELAAAILIRIGRGDEVVRRYGDPRAVFDSLPGQLKALSAQGYPDQSIRVKLDNGKHVSIKLPQSTASQGHYTEEKKILEAIRRGEMNLEEDVEPNAQAWIAMALRVEHRSLRDYSEAWSKFDIVERLLVVDERQEAPRKFVKRPKRGRPRIHPDSKIAARVRERNRRRGMKLELSAVRQSKAHVATLRELFHEAQYEGMTPKLWDHFDNVINDLEKCMSQVKRPQKRRPLKRVI